MWNSGIRASSSAERGATLAELLVVLLIVSTLAVVALPMAETAVQRRHELALREALRDVRIAIDRFHADWRDGKMKEDADGVSRNGFPTTLAVLVGGVAAEGDDTGGGSETLRYLRRVPLNPFVDPGRRISDHWRLLGYAQESGTRAWNEVDVYDLRAVTDRTGLDGTAIADW